MFTRVVIAQYQPGKLDEVIHLYGESVVPDARQQRGFKGAMALGDHSTGKAISITFWETEADAQASGMTSPYLQAQLAKIASLLATSPSIETYEVLFQE